MRSLWPILLSILIFLIVNGCEQPTEGCIDPFATNYSILADRECEEDCCNYPSLQLLISYVVEEETMDSSLYYKNNLDSYYKLNSFYLVLSQFKIIGKEREYGIINEFPDRPVVDDLVFFEYRSGSATVGEFILEDTLTGFELNFGWPDEINNPNNPNTEYDLVQTFSDSTWFDQTGYFYCGVNIEIDSSEKKNLDLNFAEVPAFDLLDVGVDTFIGKATNLILPLTVSFDVLLRDVDFQALVNENDAVDQILQNIPSAIEVK